MQELPHNCFHMTKPRIILFVSHEWTCSAHPDLNGKQFCALRYFLRHLEQIHEEYNQVRSRGGTFRNLCTHGRFQAALLFSKILQNIHGGILPRDVLGLIGVWYDYACLPQKALCGCDDRTVDQRAFFNQSLRCLKDLLVDDSCIVLSLRSLNDSYRTRLCCVVEESSYNKHNPLIRLNMYGMFWESDVDFDSDIVLERLQNNLLLNRGLHFLQGLAEKGNVNNLWYHHDLLSVAQHFKQHWETGEHVSPAHKLFRAVHQSAEHIVGQYSGNIYLIVDRIKKTIYEAVRNHGLAVTNAVCLCYNDTKSWKVILRPSVIIIYPTSSRPSTRILVQVRVGKA